MPALDAMYHSRCLSSLYRRATKVEMSDSMPNNDSLYPSIVLAEVVSFIEESRSESNTNPVFKLVDLSKMYVQRLEQLGVDVSKRIHTTRLKERILAQCPGLQ